MDKRTGVRMIRTLLGVCVAGPLLVGAFAAPRVRAGQQLATEVIGRTLAWKVGPAGFNVSVTGAAQVDHRRGTTA